MSVTTLHQPLLSTPPSSTTPSTPTPTANPTAPSAQPTTTTSTTPTRRPTFRIAHPALYFLILFGLLNLALAAYLPSLPPPLSILQPVVDLAYYLFREQCVVQAVWWTAVGLHVGETLWVWGWMLDRKGVVKGWERVAWVVQTLLLGWGSVRLMRRLPDVRRGSSQAPAATNE